MAQHFMQEQLDAGVRDSLARARVRRQQLLAGPQADAAIKPGDMTAALRRREAKQPELGDLPELTNPVTDHLNGNGRL